MAKLTFRYKGIAFTVKDIGGEDEERLVFQPVADANRLGLDLLYAKYTTHIEESFSIDGSYCQSIDPTDEWSRRRDFAESIGGKVLKYCPVRYPADAVF